MSSETCNRLDAALATFEGVVAGQGAKGSHVHDHGDHVVVALVFDGGVRGQAAALVTGQIFRQLGNGARLDGRAPVSADAALACGCPTPDAEFYGLSKQQAEVFVRVLRYATDMGYDPFRDRSPDSPPGIDPVFGTPLFVLLSHAFETLSRCYDVAGADGEFTPSLGVWSNVLRPFDDDDLDQPELIRRTVVSRRAMRALVRDLERRAWLRVDKPARGRSVLRLTAAGERARQAGARLVEAAEGEFAHRFGADRTASLREVLVEVVDRLELELPWFLTGYGLADSSPTGGQHVPAQTGPPRIPAHGADWPVVLKDPAAGSTGQPLSALLSKTLAAYRIDYEWDMRGHGTGLDFVANLLQYVDDDGIDLARASAKGGVTGNGRSALERHFVVVAEPRRGRGAPRRVHLSPKGRQARDTYPYLVARLEREWAERYGACVGRMRKALESLDEDFDTDLPNHPSTTDWLYRSMLAGSAASRAGGNPAPGNRRRS